MVEACRCDGQRWQCERPLRMAIGRWHRSFAGSIYVLSTDAGLFGRRLTAWTMDVITMAERIL